MRSRVEGYTILLIAVLFCCWLNYAWPESDISLKMLACLSVVLVVTNVTLTILV
jgi:hypothetical protein